MKKDTYYFSHDYNARTDIKIKRLIAKHGYEGYGLYWAIIEDLYQNANALPMDCESIAFDLRTNENIVNSIINDFDLFIINDGLFGSLSVQRRLIERDERSSKARDSAFKRWNKDANVMQSHSEGNAIKERKGKEMKEKDNIKFDFKKSLLELNIDTKLVDEWIKVRKAKRAVNTETAFNRFVIEVNKSSATHNEAVKMCVEKSWAGFEADWYEKNRPQPKQQTTLYKKL
jgi:hypothetical protein